MTPLMRAASEGKLKIFRQLLKAGATLMAEDNYGTNALGWASTKGASHIMAEVERITHIEVHKPTPDE